MQTKTAVYQAKRLAGAWNAFSSCQNARERARVLTILRLNYYMIARGPIGRRADNRADMLALSW